jgi:hypothetical protein
MAFDLLMGYAVAHEVGHCLLGPGHSYAELMRGALEPQGASEMSRLRLHLTKQEAWKAVARLTLAEPVAQRHQSQTRPAFLCARCKSERLTLLDQLAVFLLPDAVAFTLATGRIVAHSENGPCGLAPVKLSCREIPFPPRM